MTPIHFKIKTEEIYNDLFDNYIITRIIEYGDTESNYKK